MRNTSVSSSSVAVDGSLATSGAAVAGAATAAGVAVAAAVGAAVGAMVGAVVGAAVGAAVGVAGATVAAGVAAAGAAHVERVIASSISVTVPLRASVRPLTVTPLLSVIDVRARIVPLNAELDPSV